VSTCLLPVHATPTALQWLLDYLDLQQDSCIPFYGGIMPACRRLQQILIFGLTVRLQAQRALCLNACRHAAHLLPLTRWAGVAPRVP
jgi:hypothetical protein